jgi:two-component system, chemotaxis family, sensor kinase CheA
MTESAIKEVFISEAKEIIEKLESDLVQLEENEGDQEIINRIFRSFHTMKGSSGIVGLTSIYNFSHKLENLLDRVRSGDIAVDNRLIDLILDSIDWIRDELFSEKADTEESKSSVSALQGRIVEYTGEDKTAEAEAEEQPGGTRKKAGVYNYFRIKAQFQEDVFETGIDPLMIIEDLLTVGTLLTKNVNRDRLPGLEELDPEHCYLSWDLIIKTLEPVEKIHDVFMFVKDRNVITIDDVTSNFSGRGSELPQEKRIGEILLEKGIINEAELDAVLRYHDSHKTKIGDLIVKQGLASEKDVKDALEEQEKLKKKIELNTVRVDTNRLDNILNLLGEIVIGQSALTRIADEIDDEKDTGFQLKNALYGLDRITREFQEQIMSIRMIPIGPSFEQFRRFVRDSAHDRGKDIKLVIEGGDTELDKTVIEKISDPLKHMIRNAIDHGIELPEERTASGKGASGMVTLRAYHQEGNVYIEVIDDGRGVNLSKVRSRAVEKGLIKEDEETSKEKLLSYLFHPGFSTADRVDDLSGRGVGMDVVKTNIEELRGTVELKSEEGKGTTIRIKLPLTLAIIDGMLVSIGKNIYIIPLLSIVESMQPKKEDIKTVEGKGEMIHFRGEFVTLVRTYDLFGIEARHKNPWEGLVIIVESGNTRIGLLVDDLLGQQQIVIKSLDNYITRSRSISGAAILGDGKVALIADIHGLVEDIEDINTGK